jgi:hypothetical protein
MADTRKATPHNPYRKEAKAARVKTARQFRAANKLTARKLAKSEADEDGLPLPVHTKTSGWLTH